MNILPHRQQASGLRVLASIKARVRQEGEDRVILVLVEKQHADAGPASGGLFAKV